MRAYNKLASTALVVIALTASHGAYAQDAAGAASDQTPSTDAPTRSNDAPPVPTGDIIVTATRNSTFASKTPVALTAVTGSTLMAQGITNPTNLSDQVPNLSIDRNNGLQITIRGVTSSDNTEKGDPSAAFMSDGVYIARAQAQEVSFFDIARVEVLRGPQGTLFGRNTTAGLVQVISKNPVLGKVEGSLDLAYGNYDTQQATGVVNLPLGSAVAIRAAVNYDRRDSYLVAPGNLRVALSPAKRNLSGRLSALVDLGHGTLVLRGDYSSITGNSTPDIPVSRFYSGYATEGASPLYIAAGRSADDLRTLPANYIGLQASGGAYSASSRVRNSTWGVTADLSYDLGPVTANYIGSYREFRRNEAASAFIDAGGGTILGVPDKFDGTYSQNSQELRFSTNGNGFFKAQFGGYYFREQSNIFFRLTGLLSQTPGAPGYVYGFPQNPTTSKTWAGFAQVTMTPIDGLHLTAGLRYSHDDKSRYGFTVRCGSEACNLPTDQLTPNIASRSFSKTTWRLGVDYDFASTGMVYAVVSTGYKAGGFNDGCEAGTGALCTLTPGQLYYAPETLTAYEVGYKGRFLNNALRLNIAAFHYDYSNLQLSQLGNVGGAPATITSNAGAAKVDGVEVEGVVTPSRNDRFDFSLSWLNARYSRFSPLAGYNWAGTSLDRSPDLAFTAGYTHTIELGNGSNIQIGARTRVSDSYTIASLSTANQFRIPSYTRSDALLTFNAPNNSWYLQGFIRNIENATVVTYASTGPFGSVQIADPRTYGVRVGMKF